MDEKQYSLDTFKEILQNDPLRLLDLGNDAQVALGYLGTPTESERASSTFEKMTEGKKRPMSHTLTDAAVWAPELIAAAAGAGTRGAKSLKDVKNTSMARSLGKMALKKSEQETLLKNFIAKAMTSGDMDPVKLQKYLIGRSDFYTKQFGFDPKVYNSIVGNRKYYVQPMHYNDIKLSKLQDAGVGYPEKFKFDADGFSSDLAPSAKEFLRGYEKNNRRSFDLADVDEVGATTRANSARKAFDKSVPEAVEILKHGGKTLGLAELAMAPEKLGNAAVKAIRPGDKEGYEGLDYFDKLNKIKPVGQMNDGMKNFRPQGVLVSDPIADSVPNRARRFVSGMFNLDGDDPAKYNAHEINAYWNFLKDMGVVPKDYHNLREWQRVAYIRRFADKFGPSMAPIWKLSKDRYLKQEK